MNNALLKHFRVFLSTGKRSFVFRNGLVIVNAESKEQIDAVRDAVEKDALHPEDLSKTFMPNWDSVTDTPTKQTKVLQIVHYAISAVCGVSVVPNAFFGTTDEEPIQVNVIKGVSREEAVEICEKALDSGLALDSATVADLLAALYELGEDLSTKNYGNKEANAILVSKYGKVPSKVEQVLAALVERATGRAVLIKDAATVACLKTLSDIELLEKFVALYGVDAAAESFNRYKPLFLALKSINSKLINKISKRSKVVHKPMTPAAINLVTQELVSEKDLESSTVFGILRALNAIVLRLSAKGNSVVKIRSGKIHVGDRTPERKVGVLLENYKTLVEVLKKKATKGDGKVVYIPKTVDYAIPTSQKSFMGAIPEFTTFSSENPINVGVYWENAGGAYDLDLSAVSLGGKIGWNSYWGNDGIAYSGDITRAPEGAAEYLMVDLPDEDHLVCLNVYHGSTHSKYKLIVGDSSNSYEAMMKYKDLAFTCDHETPSEQSTIGIIGRTGNVRHFTMFNSAVSASTVSRSDSRNEAITEHVRHVAANRLSLAKVLDDLGYVVSDDADAKRDIDLTPSGLKLDTIMSLFIEA